MTIFASPRYDPQTKQINELHLRLTDESIGQLSSLLQRALNCMDPQKPGTEDWVALLDKIQNFPHMPAQASVYTGTQVAKLFP